MSHAARIAALEARSVSYDAEDLARTVDLMRRTIPAGPGDEAAAEAAARELGGRWATLPQRYHPGQASAFHTQARFRAIEAGRRSGKSEHRKREAVIAALDPSFPLRDRMVVVGGPTQDQTHALYWDDLIDLIPRRFVRDVWVSRHEIRLVNGARIRTLGMDKPQRAEGIAIDVLFLDEFADMRPEVWRTHLRPSLSTPNRPPGSATFFGTPDMRSGAHFVHLCDDYAQRATTSDDYHYCHWSSRGLVSDEEWEDARETMPAAEFAVEYEARRVTTGNRAYYEFDSDVHVVHWLRSFSRPINFCLDFNVEPGVAVITQEQSREDYPGIELPDALSDAFTAVIGEVWIPKESNTPRVVERFLADWSKHQGKVHVYGDATGGARGTAQVEGSDWDLVRRILRRRLGQGGYSMRVPRKNPPERSRTNALNGRLRSANGKVHALVSNACRHVIDDLERVSLLEGGSGELHKPSRGVGADLTHISDALGYYVAERFGGGRKLRAYAWAG